MREPHVENDPDVRLCHLGEVCDVPNSPHPHLEHQIVRRWVCLEDGQRNADFGIEGAAGRDHSAGQNVGNQVLSCGFP